ncbi:hypothetical protein FBBAL38_00050 [Flavobacteria bacterium BAL38]|nr:hypothetical protein FBBAL38_00050 [Flavobacteria bacterium BAL38]
MELLEKLIEINNTKDISQLSFLNENLDTIIIKQLEDIESKDYRTLGYPLYSLMKLDKNYRSVIISVLSKYFIVDKPNSDLNFIAFVLMYVSEFNEVEELLDKILFSNNYEVQKVLFYHESYYPYNFYIQTEKFRKAIINYVNSDFFHSDFLMMESKKTYNSFPSQYVQTFDYTNFLPIFKEGISQSKQQKLVTEYRLNSIRFINDDKIKRTLVLLYHNSYLATVYKSRFVKLVAKEFPNLKLEGYY